MKQYLYEGPVLEFNNCVTNRWKASTYAPSESKARSNLTYRFKKEHNKLPNVRITLPGRIVLVE